MALSSSQEKRLAILAENVRLFHEENHDENRRPSDASSFVSLLALLLNLTYVLFVIFINLDQFLPVGRKLDI